MIVWQRDKKGEIEKYVRKFKNLVAVRLLDLLYVWRTPPMTSDQGPVVAKIKKLQPHWRDVTGKDVEFVVSKDIWDELKDKEKERIVFRELLRLEVEIDSNTAPISDSAGRLIFWLKDPDLKIEAFLEEVQRFGLDPRYAAPYRRLTRVVGKPKNGPGTEEKEKKKVYVKKSK